MGGVGVVSEVVYFIEGVATDPTFVVMERDVLFDTRCRLELRIAGRACLCHRVMNSRDALL